MLKWCPNLEEGSGFEVQALKAHTFPIPIVPSELLGIKISQKANVGILK